MAAPKGNLYALGNNGGRPPKFEDWEVMHKKIHEYLEWEEINSKGKYALAGLALFLGFATRDSLYDYEKKSEEFSYIIKRFKLFLTYYHEQKLTWAGSFQGSFVWLKNFGGYSDESTQNQNVINYTASFGTAKKEETQ